MPGGPISRSSIWRVQCRFTGSIAPPPFENWMKLAISARPSLRPDVHQEKAAQVLGTAHAAWQARRARGGGGLYLYGPVGQGKTMLMKLFEQYLTDMELEEKANTASKPVRVLRCHYADFMLMVNALLRSSTLRKLSVEQILSGEGIQAEMGTAVYKSGEEGLDYIRDKLRVYTHLMIDEVNINNISDALIFKQLMTKLWSDGIFTVMTSNVPPDRLYEGGLNRSQFEDFIPRLQHICVPFCLDAHHDYRLDGSHATHLDIKAYNCPSPPVKDLVSLMSHRADDGKTDVQIPVIHGRTVNCAWMSESKKEALFTFQDLCGSNCAPSDYISIVSQFSSQLWLAEIPVLHVEKNANELRRLINLIDIAYEKDVPIVYFAEQAPLKLISGTENGCLDSLEKLCDYFDSHHLDPGEWWVDQKVEPDKEGWIEATKEFLTSAEASELWKCKKDQTLTPSNLK